MLPVRWDPFKDLTRELGTIHREVDELFRRTFGMTGEATPETGTLMVPPVNTFVKDGMLHVVAEIPGADRKDLDVNIDGHTLTIRGERKVTKETKEPDYLMRESRFGTFLRRLTLPEGINADKVHATYNDGILEITMPMELKAAGRKVLVEGPETGKGREIH